MFVRETGVKGKTTPLNKATLNASPNLDNDHTRSKVMPKKEICFVGGRQSPLENKPKWEGNQKNRK